ncbi:hypothetical protein GGG16DRAFT_109171 [Schizophyllum commune]
MEHGSYDTQDGGVGHASGDQSLGPEFFASMVECEWDELSAFVAGPSSFDPSSPLSPPTTVISSPQSDYASLYASHAEATRCISSAFNATRCPPPLSIHLVLPDSQIVSAGAVHFLVNSDVVAKASANDFGGTLRSTVPCPYGGPPCAYVPDSGDVLNIILHIAYKASPSDYRPTFETLANTVRCLPAYGLSPRTHAAPSTPSSPSSSPTPLSAPSPPTASPARTTSRTSHALPPPTSSPTSSTASRTPRPRRWVPYVKRLFLLHYERMTRLKGLLEQPPEFHPETAFCGFGKQRRLARAWARAVCQVARVAGPDIVSSTLSEQLGRLKDSAECPECKKTIEKRIRKVVVDWTMTPGRV